MDEAASYYEENEEGLGDEFLVEVDRAFDALLELPHVWPAWQKLDPDLGIHRHRLKRFPYSVAYRIEDDEIAVYAVARDSRRPFYWLSRVSD